MDKIALIIGQGFPTDFQLEESKDHVIDTAYGKTSSMIRSGKLFGKEILVLYRHGEDESIPSYKVNHKANIIALYEMGCRSILSTSICGSLREEIFTGEFIVCDQFIDLTKHRELSFIDKYPEEELNHSSMHKPFSEDMRNLLIESGVIQGITIHTKGTVLAVDGPRQSTRAESNLYRKFGADIINTSTTPEAILSHELNMRYGAVSLCTYYDSWRTDILPATFFEKKEIMIENEEKLKKLIFKALESAT